MIKSVLSQPFPLSYGFVYVFQTLIQLVIQGPAQNGIEWSYDDLTEADLRFGHDVDLHMRWVYLIEILHVG
jgi:hypothetical protein